MKLIWILGWMFIATWLPGQQVYISMDPDSDQKIQDYNAEQRAIKNVKVYRIQFGVFSDRRAMETELRNFENDFHITTDWHQKGPYYYMKAGNYLTKLDSYPDMQAIRSRYSGAIYVVESVPKAKLLD